MKKIIIVILSVLLSGCSSETLQDEVESLGSNPKEILENVALDYGTNRDYSVWVFDHEIRFDSEDEQYVVSLENEPFYVSIAPYINYSHT